MMNVLSPKAAEALLRSARDVHAGKKQLPPEIIAKKKQIADARKNAELFIMRLRVVDENMVNTVVRLRLELDQLYAQWAESGAN